MLYALLPTSLRFSRALILFGTLWMALQMTSSRTLGYLLKLADFQYGRNAKKRFLVIGNSDETQRVEQLLKSTSIKPDFIGLVAPNNSFEVPENYIGNLTQVPDIIGIYKITEIIFCSKDITHQEIIDKMVEWHANDLDYKIAPVDTLSIIGSNSINTRGDLYTVDIKTINTVPNRRKKRLFDFSVSFFGIVFWIFMAWFIRKPVKFLVDCLRVLFGKYSWVGYCPTETVDGQRLPEIKPGIYNPSSIVANELDDEARNRLNVMYARDYTVLKDINILTRMLLKR